MFFFGDLTRFKRAAIGSFGVSKCQDVGVIRAGACDRKRPSLFVPRRWSLAGIPMPLLLLPSGTSYETVRDGRFAFDVDISMPLIGRIVTYKGTMEPA